MDKRRRNLNGTHVLVLPDGVARESGQTLRGNVSGKPLNGAC